MSLFDQSWGRGKSAATSDANGSSDEQALARYRYMLKTAPPELVEQTHAEAFARLTPEQRQLVLQQIAAEMPASERAVATSPSNATPEGLARLATRAEVRQPGAMERMLGGGRGGAGFGGMLAGSLLGSIAGTVLGSMIAREFFSDSNHQAADSGSATDAPADSELAQNDAGMDDAGDFGGGDIDMG